MEIIEMLKTWIAEYDTLTDVFHKPLVKWYNLK